MEVIDWGSQYDKQPQSVTMWVRSEDGSIIEVEITGEYAHRDGLELKRLINKEE